MHSVLKHMRFTECSVCVGNERDEHRACVCVCVCVRTHTAALNDNSSKTVKATRFKFNMHVNRYSPGLIPYNFLNRSVARVT